MNAVTHPQLSGHTLEVVTFRAGGQRCAVEARSVRASRPLSADIPPPLAQRIGLQEETDGPRQLLLFKHPQGDIPCAVTPPVQLQAVPVEYIHPLPPLLAATTKISGLRALILDADGIILLVELAE